MNQLTNYYSTLESASSVEEDTFKEAEQKARAIAEEVDAIVRSHTQRRRYAGTTPVNSEVSLSQWELPTSKPFGDLPDPTTLPGWGAVPVPVPASSWSSPTSDIQTNTQTESLAWKSTSRIQSTPKPISVNQIITSPDQPPSGLGLGPGGRTPLTVAHKQVSSSSSLRQSFDKPIRGSNYSVTSSSAFAQVIEPPSHPSSDRLRPKSLSNRKTSDVLDGKPFESNSGCGRYSHISGDTTPLGATITDMGYGKVVGGQQADSLPAPTPHNSIGSKIKGQKNNTPTDTTVCGPASKQSDGSYPSKSVVGHSLVGPASQASRISNRGTKVVADPPSRPQSHHTATSSNGAVVLPSASRVARVSEHNVPVSGSANLSIVKKLSESDTLPRNNSTSREPIVPLSDQQSKGNTITDIHPLVESVTEAVNIPDGGTTELRSQLVTQSDASETGNTSYHPASKVVSQPDKDPSAAIELVAIKPPTESVAPVPAVPPTLSEPINLPVNASNVSQLDEKPITQPDIQLVANPSVGSSCQQTTSNRTKEGQQEVISQLSAHTADEAEVVEAEQLNTDRGVSPMRTIRGLSPLQDTLRNVLADSISRQRLLQNDVLVGSQRSSPNMRMSLLNSDNTMIDILKGIESRDVTPSIVHSSSVRGMSPRRYDAFSVAGKENLRHPQQQPRRASYLRYGTSACSSSVSDQSPLTPLSVNTNRFSGTEFSVADRFTSPPRYRSTASSRCELADLVSCRQMKFETARKALLSGETEKARTLLLQCASDGRTMTDNLRSCLESGSGLF
eukprot:TRINITY_DN19038_c0_g1_i2.p1 TRINITY_DN19038_c0_g1~~TRINITY_DN19038_c0_g1_i2.p1  ORF type:complete len:909 (+),score=167.63 TRINITY_DN19038_c0_g1_i2:365-2728(+)